MCWRRRSSGGYQLWPTTRPPRENVVLRFPGVGLGVREVVAASLALTRGVGMGAETVPQEPRFTTASEREVWERLVRQLGPSDVVAANLRLTDEDKDHELDLVVLMPGAGVVVVEVKG